MKRMGFKECIDCDIFNNTASNCMKKCNLPIIAMKKQIPASPITQESDNGHYEECPNCFQLVYEDDNFCSECGQSLCWEQ